MKRRFVSVLLCLLALCCVFTACSNGDPEATTVPETTPEVTTTSGRITAPILTAATTTPEPEPADMPNDEKLLVGGVNITSYVIVYADSPLNTKVGSKTGKTIGEDIGDLLQGENHACDFDYQSAVRLRDLIKEYYGYELEIVADSATEDPSRYEILIGATDRLASKRIKASASLKEEQYQCAMDSLTKVKTQYVIYGGSYGATWHAIDELEAFFKANSPATTADLTSVNVTAKSYDFETVACIGDSITRGSQAITDGSYATSASLSAQFGSTATGVYIEQYLSYPATLQRELWKDYLVFNYGQGWSTMRDYFPNKSDTGPYFYHDTNKFKNCLAQSNRDDFDFDVVLMMLGTNDSSKMQTNWTDDTIQDYRDQAKILVDKIKEGSPDAKFVLMNVPHRCDGHSEHLGDSMMRDIQKQLAIDFKLEGYNVYHYDMEAFNIENMGTGCGSTKDDELKAHEDYYNILTQTGGPDTTHPNYRGYGKIAEGMMDLLAYLQEGAAAPKYMIDIG